MEYRKLGRTDYLVSVICLGTWAFGGDAWWGYQEDKDSFAVLEEALSGGVNFIDTAPVYGRGRSEKVIGEFIKRNNNRRKITLATKIGLSWQGRKVFPDLNPDKMRREIDESRKRLNTDYIDLYQVHWPDENTPIGKIAEVMLEFLRKGWIRAIGVSNYSVEQMKEFLKYAPLTVLQPPYNMFLRDIERDIVPFCRENNISIISYTPLHSGILTGKFFFSNKPVPNDLSRQTKPDLKEPLFSLNKEILAEIKNIADKYGKTLTQFVINWNFSQPGITSAIVGARKKGQVRENIGSVGWEISREDQRKVNDILGKREEKKQVFSI